MADSQRVTEAEDFAINEVNRIQEIANCTYVTCKNNRSRTLRYMMAGVSHDSIVWLARSIHEIHEGKRAMQVAEICPTCNYVIPGAWQCAPLRVEHNDEGKVIRRWRDYCKCPTSLPWSMFTRSLVTSYRERLRANHGLDDVIGLGQKSRSAKGGGELERQD